MANTTLLELQEITTRMLQQNVLDVADNPNYPEDLMTAFINDGQNALLRELDHDIFRKSKTKDATAAAITVETDFMSHMNATFVNGTSDRNLLIPRSERYLDQHRPNWRDETGTRPTEYVLNLTSAGATTITLVPTMSATVSNGLFYTYTPKAADLSADGDSPLILTWFPEVQRTVLCYWACYRLLLFDGSEESDAQVQKFLGLFRADVALIHRACNRMTLNTPVIG